MGIFPTFRKTLISFLLLLSSQLFSQQLSDSSNITLLTVWPGNEIYSYFGHTGIRVTDYKQGFDVVFNYGTFDFDQPGFVANFLRGKMRYMLSVDDFPMFREQYVFEKRRVEEQQLRLTPDDKQAIFYFLATNAAPENREYYYDFFWDNCATRPRDVFFKTLGKRIIIDSSVFNGNQTMRQTLKPYVQKDLWLDFGFDLILGMPCEIKAGAMAQTYLPDKLALMFDHTTVDGQPFVTGKNVILDIPPDNTPDQRISPITVTFFILVIGIALTFIERMKNIHYWWFDFILFFFSGFMGVFFLCMWLFTSHYSVPENLNMLWLLPTHLVVAFFLLRKQKQGWLIYYFGATLVILLLLLIGWKWNPQPYNLAVLPLILLLANRAMRIALRVKQQQLAL